MNVTIHEAKTHLSKLIKEAVKGEDVVISRGKQPVAKIVPFEINLPERRLDGAADLVQFMSDDFNDELDVFENYG